MADSYGIEVERRRREITAYHGVPDFVFRPVDVRKGSAQREVGDFLLWVGNVVAVVSHKAREPAAAARETQERRRAWLDSHIAEAYGQVQGVVRNLKAAPQGEIVLESERGVKVPWDPTRVIGYVGVVIVDAPDPEEDYAPPVMNDGVPTIAMLAREWDILNELLPSTRSLIHYAARRQINIPRCPLGAELDIFALLIEQEQTGCPISIPESGLPKRHFGRTRATHPEWFLGGNRDDRFSFVVDAMIEGASDADPELSDAGDPLAYMRIVEFLDRIPLLQRVSIGKAIIDRCERVGVDGGRQSGRLAVPHGQVVFVIDDGDRTDRANWLRSLTFARHSQALDGGAPPSIVTLGVATQPIPSGNGRSHDFVFIEGGVRSDPEFRAERDDLFGAVDMVPLVNYWNGRSS